MFRYIFCAAAFVSALPSLGVGNEIEGFRLGMTTDQITKLATEKGYSFSDAIKSGPNWTTYILLKDGPVISFCDNVLGSVTRADKSNLHEFVHLTDRWKRELGAPDETAASQTYSLGVPISRLEHKWKRQDNVKQDISLSQSGINDLQLSYGYSYIDHPCLPTASTPPSHRSRQVKRKRRLR